MNICIEYNGEPVEFATFLDSEGQLVLILDEIDIDKKVAKAGREQDLECRIEAQLNNY